MNILVDGRPIDYSSLPEGFQGSFKRYLEGKIEPGNFIKATIQNNLIDAVCLCSDITTLRPIMIWLHNYAPPKSFGSVEKYEEYLKKEKT